MTDNGRRFLNGIKLVTQAVLVLLGLLTFCQLVSALSGSPTAPSRSFEEQGPLGYGAGDVLGVAPYYRSPPEVHGTELFNQLRKASFKWQPVDPSAAELVWKRGNVHVATDMGEDPAIRRIIVYIPRARMNTLHGAECYVKGPSLKEVLRVVREMTAPDSLAWLRNWSPFVIDGLGNSCRRW